MASRKIRRERFRILDELGINAVCQMYVEGGPVKELCQGLFDPSKYGMPGNNLLYAWLNKRGFRHVWDFAVRYKRKAHEDALRRVELEVPEHDWQREAALASVFGKED